MFYICGFFDTTSDTAGMSYVPRKDATGTLDDCQSRLGHSPHNTGHGAFETAQDLLVWNGSLGLGAPMAVLETEYRISTLMAHTLCMVINFDATHLRSFSTLLIPTIRKEGLIHCRVPSLVSILFNLYRPWPWEAV